MASPIGFEQATFEFFEQLAEHNDRAWFKENKATYEQFVREPFVALLDEVSGLLEQADVPLQGGAKTLMRINRDIRFSKDKSPYQLAQSGYLSPDGTRGSFIGVGYIQVSAHGGLLGAGTPGLDAKHLAPIRDRIIDQPQVFGRILSDLSAAGLELDTSESLRSMPRGYGDYAEHPQAPLLRLKSFGVRQTVDRDSWIDGSVARQAVDLFESSAPLLAFLRADT